ncbi:MAG: polysaccharide deacetylase family protein, partial [Acidimicrobiales bacterium]|nr:polysaccharide deacetylase family protein [Acidimicrobiales bacterium]
MPLTPRMVWSPGKATTARLASRLAALAAAALVVFLLARVDAVAAGISACGGAAVWALLRGRSPSRPRRVATGLVIGATAVAVIAALGLPAYRGAPPPLVVAHEPRLLTSTATADAGAVARPATPGLEALGFVSTDNEDSWAGVDRDAAGLSTLAATGIVLGHHGGSIEVTPEADVLVRSHLNGTRALAVVSNYDGTNFDPGRAAAMMHDPGSRRRFVSAVTSQVARQGWDGVVLDLESLPPSLRTLYPEVLSDLRAALGGRTLMVTVPATGDADLGAYDLASLSGIADRIVWMAYDQHDPTGPPGPVAGLPWVRQSLMAAEAAIPRDKLLLGVAGYGYAWTAPGHGADLTVPEARALADQPGSVARWDDTQQEWAVHVADGRQVYFDDARSVAARAQLASTEGLGGIALWRVGSEDPATLASLPIQVRKDAPLPVSRRVQEVQASGVAALTFDDGPNPTWTPQILRVLRAEHVPATFFVIGKEAERFPSLVRDEIANGDVVGNHTYSHPQLTASTPRWRTRLEILGDEAVIEGVTGRKPVLFRSPYGGGDMSARGLGTDQRATNLGMHVVSWNVDSADWLRPGIGAVEMKVLGAPPGRAVILLHDGGGDRAQTVAALPAIIDGLRARGYTFTTVDGLDGSVTSPYAVRRTVGDQARAIGIMAAYRLQLALRHDGVAVLWIVIALSLARIIASGVLAVVHWRRGSATSRRVPLATPAMPSVSVIVPAHNEARVIDKTITAIRRLRVAPSEVIVVDDGSTDATAEIARARGATVLSQRRQGKAVALDAGVARSTGEIVVVLDADTVLRNDFLDALLPHFADPRVGAVAGNVKVGNRRGLLGRLQALEY